MTTKNWMTRTLLNTHNGSVDLNCYIGLVIRNKRLPVIVSFGKTDYDGAYLNPNKVVAAEDGTLELTTRSVGMTLLREHLDELIATGVFKYESLTFRLIEA